MRRLTQPLPTLPGSSVTLLNPSSTLSCLTGACCTFATQAGLPLTTRVTPPHTHTPATHTHTQHPCWSRASREIMMSAELSRRVLFLPHSAGAWCVGTHSFLSIVIVACLVQRCEPLTQGHIADFFSTRHPFISTSGRNWGLLRREGCPQGATS